MAHAQHVDVRGHEGLIRLLRRADDRIPSEVDARIHDHGAAGLLAIPHEELVVETVALRVDRLDARGIVDVGDRRQLRPHHRQLLDAADLAGVRRGQALPCVHRRDDQHVGAVLAGPHVDVLVDVLPEDRGRERPEALAKLDLEVHHRLHVPVAGVAQDAARAERPRTELHAPLEPSHHLAGGDAARHLVTDRGVVRQAPGGGPDASEKRSDLLVVERGTEQRSGLAVARLNHARLVEQLVPDEPRRAERSPRIAGRGLNPDALERSLLQDPAVADAVQRHAAGQAQVPHAGLAVEMPRRPQHGVLGHLLDRGGEIHVALGEQRVRLARRAAKQRVELPGGHRETRAVVEVGQVQPERPVLRDVDEALANEVGVAGLPVGREAHQLVLAGIHLEAAVVGEGRIQQPERVRKADLVRELEAVAAPTP